MSLRDNRIGERTTRRNSFNSALTSLESEVQELREQMKEMKATMVARPTPAAGGESVATARSTCSPAHLHSTAPR